MNEQFRQRDRFGGSGDPGSDDTGTDLSAVREQGQRLLDAGNDAISRALSGDSEGFLAASRQRGGQ